MWLLQLWLRYNFKYQDGILRYQLCDLVRAVFLHKRKIWNWIWRRCESTPILTEMHTCILYQLPALSCGNHIILCTGNAIPWEPKQDTRGAVSYNLRNQLFNLSSFCRQNCGDLEKGTTSWLPEPCPVATEWIKLLRVWHQSQSIPPTS